MLHLGSTYLIVKDMEKSINFYEKLLKMKPTAKNFDRWAQFDFDDQCIALYNDEFDKRMFESGENLKQHYDDAYLRFYRKRKINYGNNMVLNFWIEDLKKEHERIKRLNIGNVSEIMYLNVASPYYLFIVEDPDGNTIEITGGYEE